MDLKKLLGNVPWITKEGYLDPAKFPIDSALKQALSDDDRSSGRGLNMLGSMYVPGLSGDTKTDPPGDTKTDPLLNTC